MTEKQTINDKDVWLKVDAYHVERDNPNIIPTEYFIVSYYLNEPFADAKDGELFKEENGDVMLFESPVEALGIAGKKLQRLLQ